MSEHAAQPLLSEQEGKGMEDTMICEHPKDTVMWNPYNEVVQCHSCGEIQKDPSEEGSGGEVS